MTITRILLNAAGIVAGVVFVQELVLFLYEFGFQVATGASFSPPASQFFGYALPGVVISGLVLAVGFGAGMFVSLGRVAPVLATQSWRRVAINGLIAAALGALGVLILRVVQSLLAAVHIGPYPLGYSFTATINSSNVWIGSLGAFGAAFAPFVYNVPLAVLACAFLKLWLTAHSATVEVNARASASV